MGGLLESVRKRLQQDALYFDWGIVAWCDTCWYGLLLYGDHGRGREQYSS